ncbi:MAG: MIP/aquaporin family protein [bacterium]
MEFPLYKRVLAEAFGTFWIVFAGTGAVIVGDISGAISHGGVAMVFGLIVFAMIAALGDVSGAHFNPAVTIGFSIARRFPARHVLPYIAGQCAGALIGSGILLALFPGHGGLGATLPSGSATQSWVLELIMTLGLMFVILGVSTGAKEKGITAGLAIGAVVGLEAMFGGPVSGASMNPARSLGPAVVSGQLSDLWIYLTAPVVGAALAVLFCFCSREDECCGGDSSEVPQ